MVRYSKASYDFYEALQFDSLPKTPVETAKVAALTIAEDINPVKLRDILMTEYGVEWLDWLPEVLDKTIFGEKRNDILSNKAQAIRVCLTTDTPWLEWNIFENCGKSFNHQLPNFNIIQPLSLGECETTMATMRELREEEPFSEEVLSYVASVAAHENFVYLPDNLLIGQAIKNLKHLIYDFGLQTDTETAWRKVKDKNLLNIEYTEDNPLHRQLAKLAFVKQYAEEFRHA